MAAKNIFLFYGPDNYTAGKKVMHWREEFEKKYGDLNIHVLDGEKITAGDFNEAVSTLPFLSDKKLVIVRDFLAEATEDDRKRLTEYLDKIPDYCVTVFIEHKQPDARTALYKKLVKLGQAIAFSDLDKPRLIEWIKKRFSEKSSAIGAAEAELLADLVGPNLWQMDQEVEKLTLYGQKNKIDRKAVEDLASPNLSASIFKLTDYIAAKNVRMSLKTLDTLISSGEDLFQIFFMIVRHIRILIHTKACLGKKMDRQAIVKETGFHPYTVTTAISQCKNLQFNPLTRIHRALLQIDMDTKNGRIRTTTEDNTELRLALEKLILKTCA